MRNLVVATTHAHEGGYGILLIFLLLKLDLITNTQCVSVSEPRNCVQREHYCSTEGEDLKLCIGLPYISYIYKNRYFDIILFAFGVFMCKLHCRYKYIYRTLRFGRSGYRLNEFMI